MLRSFRQVRSSREVPYAAFVVAHRDRLLATAWLLTGDARKAEQAVESVLARLYLGWPRTADPLTATYRGLLTGPSGPVPWRREDRVQLHDASTRASLPPGLVADLQGLPVAARRVFVLERMAGLPPDQVARLVDTSVVAVHEWALRARADLVRADPRRVEDAWLTAELTESATVPPGAFSGASGDLARGHLLIRRRRGRRALLAAVGAVVVVLASVQGVQRPEPAATPPPAPVAPSFRPPPGQLVDCDARQPPCQNRALRDWRDEMARVTGSYLDPSRAYFDGYAYSYTDLYETPGFWSGQPGGLGLDMFHVQRGSTEVYLQIATDRQAAVPCGQITGHRCASMRFMDGNRYLLTNTTAAFEGMEVQYRPYGDQVITVVVRDRANGRPLEISRADLLSLVQDKRLRLPRI